MTKIERELIEAALALDINLLYDSDLLDLSLGLIPVCSVCAKPSHNEGCPVLRLSNAIYDYKKLDNS